MTADTFRVLWVDAAKGIGITLVVLGHALRGLHERGVLEGEIFREIDMRIYAFHMPLFFLLSGIFFWKALRISSAQQFVHTRVVRLLYPMILWTYIFIAFKVVAGSMSNAPLSLGDIWISPVPGKWHMWFLWSLFLMQLSFVIIYPLRNSLSGPVVGWGALSISLLLLFVPLPDGLIPWIRNAVVYFPFFAVGMVIGLRIEKFSDLAVGSPFFGPLSGALFVVVVWLAPVWPDHRVVVLILQTLVCISLLIVIVSITHRFALRWLVLLGVVSLPIYVAHTIFSAGFREFMLRVGLEDPVFHLVLGTVIGLVGPFVMWLLVRRTRAAVWLGF